MKNLKFLSLMIIGLFLMNSCSDDEPFVGSETTFDYTLHNGQAVPSLPYSGMHPNDFSASMSLKENENGTTEITVELMNTISGATYHIHAHDSADAATTPNGTPYSESPNSGILVQMVEGNGSSVSVTQQADISYDELINEYSGFFVIHDPLQAISTTDISSYLVVGGFARSGSDASYNSQTYNYDFNTGQLVPAFAYSGSHSSDLAASIQVDELADGRSRITARIMNTMDGETYNTHAHDMADPTTTPNGTPYIESPNGAVFANQIEGNGGMAGATNISDMSYAMITGSYDGFFVVHDPLQAITTTDPTTYVILGVFAR